MPIPRFRFTAGQTQQTTSYVVTSYGPSPGPPSSGVVLNGNYAGTYKSISDLWTKGFRKSRDPQHWVMNPLTIENLSVRASSGSATTRNNPNGSGQGLERTWSGDVVSYLLGPLCPKPNTVNFGSYPDLVNIGNLQSLAAIGCLNRINPSSMQAIVSAAEVSKSVSMILTRARKLALVITALKKGDVPTLQRLLPGTHKARYPKRVVLWNSDGQPIVNGLKKVRDSKGNLVATPVLDRRYGHMKLTPRRISGLTVAAKLELEWSLGWKPLVYEIIDALKAINAQVLRTSLTSKDYYAVYERKSSSQSQTTSGTPFTKDGGTWSWTQEIKHTVDVYAYCKYAVSHEDGVMNRLNDFGIFSIPGAIWELVPLSFVVDYFIGVGNWLQACTPKVGVRILDSGITTRHSKEVTRTITGYAATLPGAVGSWPSPPFPLGSSDGFKSEAKVRTIGLTVPWFPPNDVFLNVNRLANLAALFRVLSR